MITIWDKNLQIVETPYTLIHYKTLFASTMAYRYSRGQGEYISSILPWAISCFMLGPMDPNIQALFWVIGDYPKGP